MGYESMLAEGSWKSKGSECQVDFNKTLRKNTSRSQKIKMCDSINIFVSNSSKLYNNNSHIGLQGCVTPTHD